MKKITALHLRFLGFFISAVVFGLAPGAVCAADALPWAVPESVGMSSKRLQRIRPFMQRYVDEGKLSGVVTLVSRHGKVVHFESCGQRDEEAKRPMKCDTLVRIYSMTKPIAAVGLMMLQEEGAFQLNNPAQKFLPEFRDLKVLEGDEEVQLKRKMTIHHLLTHTAGLTYGFFGNTPVDQKYKEAGILRESNLEEMIQNLAGIPLQYHPGEQWHYSVAVDVQGALIERLSGMPLDRYFRERIFEPLGMEDTFFEVPPGKLNRFAANYRYQGGKQRRVLADPPNEKSKFAGPVTFFSAGGGLVSTAADYWKFCQMLLNGGDYNGVRLLGRKTVEWMTRDHLPAVLEDPKPNFAFGLGFRVILDVPSTKAPGSEGEYSWEGAAGTIFWIDPEEDLIAVMMIQLMSSPYNLKREMKSLVYQAIVD